jgi:hypothetical protein
MGIASFSDASVPANCVQLAATEEGSLVMEVDCGASTGHGSFDQNQLDDLLAGGYRLTEYGNARREDVVNDPQHLASEIERVFVFVLRRLVTFEMSVLSAKGG